MARNKSLKQVIDLWFFGGALTLLRREPILYALVFANPKQRSDERILAEYGGFYGQKNY